MSKQRLENELKLIKKNLQEVKPDIHTEIVKECLLKGKTPRDPKLKELVRLIEDCYYVALCAKTLPSMPNDSWMEDHGTVAQPLDWKDDIPRPETSTRVKKPHIVKRNMVK
jgi:hypothetical protein